MKTQTAIHRCASCGYSSPKWFGRCPDCGGWSTASTSEPGQTELVAVSTLDLATESDPERVASGVGEFDRVVGGGLVRGSAVLLAGEPGIGKSTLVLQVVDGLVRSGRKCLLATGEESLEQVSLRARRLGLRTGEMKAMATASLDAVLASCSAERPEVLIVDSIQTLEDGSLEQAAGSPMQVRECANRLVRLAKTSGTTVIIVGHVTKDGGVAGPKTLEHVVDAVLSLDGERTGTLRLLRAAKNRFGSCEETGVFVMSETGLSGVPDPSQLLIGDRRHGVPGSIVYPAMQGSRPMLMEIQALVVPSKLGRRVAIGIDARRLALVIGVLGKRRGLDFSDKDVFVAAAGGAVTNEPAADLAIALALTSAYEDKALPDAVAVGELGLAGEVRSVPSMSRRLKEAARLGISAGFVPPSASSRDAARVVDVEDIAVAIERAFSARVSRTPSIK